MAIYDTSRAMNTTAQMWLSAKDQVDNTIRKSLWLTKLRKMGRIKTGMSGEYLVQTLQFADGTATTRADGSPIVYAPVDRWRKLEIPWRTALVPDSITEGEKLKNTGVQAIVKILEGMTDRCKNDLDVLLRTQLYTDGNANSTDFHGFDSFTGTGTTAAGDLIAEPSDTYMGKSTLPGAEAGTWTTAMTTKPNAHLATDWPSGSGSASYDWLSPKLPNWSSSAWGTALTTWIGNCERSLRYGKTACDITAAGKGKLDFVTMDMNLLNDFKNKESTKQQIWQPYKEGEDLGFTDSVLFDGMVLSAEFGCPANAAYGHNLENEFFGILGPDFYRAKGPTPDPGTLSDLFSVSIWGNLLFNPKYCFKASNYA